MSYRTIAALGLLVAVPGLHADSFDHYTNDILRKVPNAKTAKRVSKVTATDMVIHSGVLPGVSGCFLVVKTNDGRMSRLLVQPAEQKLGEKGSVPILLVERFVTFRDGEERTIHAQGQNLRLFKDFRLNLDIGQVVPDGVPADVRLVPDGDTIHVEAVGKAEVYLVSKHLPEATPKKLPRPQVGATFEARFFNGRYKLYDDGRRSGTLHLKVADNGDVDGFYYSDKDGQKYEVNGKVSANPNYAIHFKVIYPRTLQTFQGMMFTGDGRAIAGSSRMQEREAGFYAVRLEQ